jgi:hypothetical protein
MVIRFVKEAWREPDDETQLYDKSTTYIFSKPGMFNLTFMIMFNHMSEPKRQSTAETLYEAQPEMGMGFSRNKIGNMMIDLAMKGYVHIEDGAATPSDELVAAYKQRGYW